MQGSSLESCPKPAYPLQQSTCPRAWADPRLSAAVPCSQEQSRYPHLVSDDSLVNGDGPVWPELRYSCACAHVMLQAAADQCQINPNSSLCLVFNLPKLSEQFTLLRGSQESWCTLCVSAEWLLLHFNLLAYFQ